MKKIKVSDATNNQLNWIVAICEGYTDWCADTEKFLPPRKEYGLVDFYDLNYVTDREQGGAILEREKISTVWVGFQWCAGTGDIGEIYRSDEGNHFTGIGSTQLVAGMRAYVTSKLGEEVEVPEELI